MSEYEFLSSPGTASPTPSSNGHQPGAKRRPIPRKGHTKSRAGCPNCKRRKVKCDEVTPVCGPCKRLGLECEYAQTHVARRKESQLASRLAVGRTVPQPLSMYSGSFGFTDLRFFQHFLISAFPPLPVGGRYVWQYISQMSHEVCQYLHDTK